MLNALNGGVRMKITRLFTFCSMGLMLVLLVTGAAYASAILPGEQTRVLRGGCHDICKNFDCGDVSHCYQGNCNLAQGPIDCGVTKFDCNLVPDVPMCVGPHPLGTITCPSQSQHQHCGECTDCYCEIIIREGQIISMLCLGNDEQLYYQKEFLPCP